MCNSSTKDITVKLPVAGKSKQWYRLVDTSVPAPNDFLEEENAELVEPQRTYILPSRTMVVLQSR